MIVNTSANGAPSKINLRMLSTDSPEKRPASLSVDSTLGRMCERDSLTVAINHPLLPYSVMEDARYVPISCLSCQLRTVRVRRGESHSAHFQCYRFGCSN